MNLQHKSLGDGFIYACFNDTFTTVNQFYAVFDRVKVVSYSMSNKKKFSWKKIRIWAEISNLDFRHVTSRMFSISYGDFLIEKILKHAWPFSCLTFL